MLRLYLLVAFALLSNEALGFRIKRQSQGDGEGVLDDRYGWNRPGGFPNQGQWGGNPQGWRNPQDRFPNPGSWMFPDPYPGGFPWQVPNPNPGGRPNPAPRPNPFPEPNPVPNPSPVPDPGQQTTQAPNSGSTTQNPVLQDCLRTCPVTPEYNPVCGSDNVTYDNPGRLICAQACGVSVSQARATRCPGPTPAPA